MNVDLADYVGRQQAWSARVFGLGARTIGITKHIEKEIEEVRASPDDLMEWIDLMIIAMDGYWRAGGSPSHLMDLLERKQAINFARKWPPPGPQDEATEHCKTSTDEPIYFPKSDIVWDAHQCPNCGTSVGVGCMSLAATCKCGYYLVDAYSVNGWWSSFESYQKGEPKVAERDGR